MFQIEISLIKNVHSNKKLVNVTFSVHWRLYRTSNKTGYTQSRLGGQINDPVLILHPAESQHYICDRLRPVSSVRGDQSFKLGPVELTDILLVGFTERRLKICKN